MQCPNCLKDNQPGAKFCIYCGSPLFSTPDGEKQRQLPIDEEISRLRQLIAEITQRLDTIESRARTAEPETHPEPPPPPVPQPEVEPILPVTAVPEEAPKPEAVTPPPKKPVVQKEREWEQILGGSWLARIGVLALIIGAGFFLKYAFDNEWLGPAGRVILGIIAGLVMIGLAFYWRKRYPIMTRVLTGGGIAILYLSIFASFAFFYLVSIYLAIACLLVISIASALLALYYNSMALAVLGIIGAFFAPFILGGFGDRATTDSGTGQALGLLAYIIIVDIGVLVLATFRNWRWFTLLALLCSLITYGIWYSEYDNTVGIGAAEAGITIIFLIFVGATSLFHIIWRRAPQAFDFSLMLINAAAYFGISLGIMWDEFRGWMGGFVFLLAAFYGIIAYLAFQRHEDTTRLSLFATGIALIFLSVAIPIQLGDRAWTTVAWAAEGAVLMWLAIRAKVAVFRIYSYLVFALVVIRLLAFDTFMRFDAFQPVFNERFLAFIISIITSGLVTYILWKNHDEKQPVNYLTFLGLTNFLILWIVGAEVFVYSQQAMTTSDSLRLLILLILVGIIVLYPVFWRRQPTRLDMVLHQVNPVALVIISIFLWEDMRAWMGSIYLILAILYGFLAFRARVKESLISAFGSYSVLISTILFTGAVAVQLENTVWTTIVWAVELVVLMQLSFTLKIPQLRNYGYIVFLAMAVRLIFFDTPVEIGSFQPVINERFLAFIVGIAATYLAAYILWRHKKDLSEWGTPASTLLIGANFLTIWIFSFEVWHSFDAALRDADFTAREGLRNAQNLSLTAVWAVYALAGLVVGIARRWRYVRLGSLILLAIPIVKVFVYDVFKLELGYRIGAFIGLGVLLLVSAYLYQRYSHVIKGVFKNTQNEKNK